MELFFGDIRDKCAYSPAMMKQSHQRRDYHTCVLQCTVYSADLPSPKRFVQAGVASAT
jgi:hypothetical protein